MEVSFPQVEIKNALKEKLRIIEHGKRHVTLQQVLKKKKKVQD